ncbi:hypothetical protein [Microbulbifer sp. VAAF005]|uniref:hypothetical protein n=1 Tax=Microbulbifer sp. VAAF005 TaxID=3034230 RepID=UPI0024AD4EEA|nr:hypothetical protein [Microbulbifer sp. VAAF005]WHI46444.1 hypothetical protein P0078_22490 [Microbulbifer sp. VAAF005]
MIYIKYLFAILLPWLAFFTGDKIYGSSHLMFHHPCVQSEYGCWLMDFMSFAIKGALLGILLGLARFSASQLKTSVVSAVVLLTMVTVRLGAARMEGVLTVVLDWYYWLSLFVPLLLAAVVFYLGSRYVAEKL